MNKAGKIYLSILCAEGYPEQEPEWKYAKSYHLLWLLIPIAGLLLFVLAVQDAAKAKHVRNAKAQETDNGQW